MATSKRWDVFLSHSGPDKPAVEELAERLRAAGLEPFLDKWHLVPGEPWQEALEVALDESCTCAVFLGPAGMTPWKHEEMRSALDERVANPDYRVIPVLLPGAPDPKTEKLPRFLRRDTWVDFRPGLDDPDAFHRLVCGIVGVAPAAGAEGARSPRVAARAREIDERLRAFETLRPDIGDEAADRGKVKLEEERAHLETLKVHLGGEAPNRPRPGPKTTPADPAAEALLAGYFRGLAEECSQLPLGVLDPRFTTTAGQSALALHDVYVDLDVVVAPPTSAGEPGDREDPAEGDSTRFALRLGRGEGGKRTPVLEAVAAVENGRVVLLGDAGSGKTTFVHYLAYLLAAGAQALPEPLSGLLPVRLVLREVAARHLPADAVEGDAAMLWAALREDVVRRLGAAGGATAFDLLQARLVAEGGLVLPDGLDEVPEAGERRRVLREAVSEFAGCLGPRTRLVVTARPYAYAQPAARLAGFSTLALAPFDEGQIERFVERWYGAVQTGLACTPATARERAAELTAALRDRDRSYLGDLGSRPLLLTLMATLHSSWGKLPQDRADLYEEIVKLLLDRWQRARQVKGSDGRTVTEPGISEALEVHAEAIRGRLEELAFEVHERQRSEPAGREESADISEGDLLAAFRPLLGALPPDQLLRYLRDRAGLLIERRDGVYAFPHRSFQEYLAGAYLANRPDADLELRRRVVEDPAWWREAFLLAVGKARQGGLSRAVSAVRALVAGGEEGDLRWRLAALAGEALVELRLRERAGPDLATYEGLVVDDVRTRLTALIAGGHLPPRERLAAADALGQLGDRRRGVGVAVHREAAVPDFEWIKVPAGSFAMGSAEDEEGARAVERPRHTIALPCFYLARYPVTNAQFAAFVAAGGYERQELWTEEGWAWRQGRDPEPDLSSYPESVRDSVKEWLAGRPPDRRDRPLWWRESRSAGANRPVVGVTWYEATAFCRWADEVVRESSWWREQENRVDGCRARLPSEAEWERAARKRKGDRWPWGNAFGEGRCNSAEVGLNQTSPVGMFPAGRNPFGLDDMAGNVWEWTTSRFEPYPYDAEDGRETPTGQEPRVVRGGSWLDDAGWARCAYRVRHLPTYFAGDVGFRCGVFPGLVPDS